MEDGRRGSVEATSGPHLHSEISTEENFLFTDLDAIIKMILLPIIFRVNRRWFCSSACGFQLKLKG